MKCHTVSCVYATRWFVLPAPSRSKMELVVVLFVVAGCECGLRWPNRRVANSSLCCCCCRCYCCHCCSIVARCCRRRGTVAAFMNVQLILLFCNKPNISLSLLTIHYDDIMGGVLPVHIPATRGVFAYFWVRDVSFECKRESKGGLRCVACFAVIDRSTMIDTHSMSNNAIVQTIDYHDPFIMNQ